LFTIKQTPSQEVRDQLITSCGVKVDDVSTPTKQSALGDIAAMEYMALNSDSNGIENGHKLLVSPAVSHILVCFEPTIIFMKRIERLIGVKLQNFNIFLNDFVSNIYLPHVQEQILVFHHSNINSIDAFQADKNAVANLPLIKVQ
jgi:hypothetical protein